MAFWEAKLVNNGEARASQSYLPRVIGQIEGYRSWIRTDNNAELVVSAYQMTCKAIVTLWEVARERNPQIEPLGDGIRAVAGGADLVVDDTMRLLIDARSVNKSFIVNGHLDRLRKHADGLHVQMVERREDMVLEQLP